MTTISMSKLTVRQREALMAAHLSSDGWIARGASRVWSTAPAAVYALIRKGLLEFDRRSTERARLTARGRAVVEREGAAR
jgi:hypothetical protein